MTLELEVALRYLRSRPSRLVSSVSVLSVAGIALGVAALVVAMGLLSGYRREIREKLIGANAPIVVFPLSGGFRTRTRSNSASARCPESGRWRQSSISPASRRRRLRPTGPTRT